MNDRPHISIVVPVYNTEKYLHKCVDSILAQTFEDFELLLIDDGSNDASGAICDEYASKDVRIRVFHKLNGGVSSARNVGLDNAKGEWVAFVDSDDCVDKDWLDGYDLTTDAGIQIQGIRYVVGTTVLRQLDLPLSLYSQSEWFEASYKLKLPERRLKFHFPFSKLYRQTIINEYGIRFQPGIHLAEDLLFNMTCYLHCDKVLVLPCTSYSYLVENSLLSNKQYSCETMMRWNESFLPVIARIKAINPRACDYFLSVRMTPVLNAAFRHRAVTLNSKTEALEYYKHLRTDGMDGFLLFPYSVFRWLRWLPMTMQARLLSILFFLLRPFKRPQY